MTTKREVGRMVRDFERAKREVYDIEDKLFSAKRVANEAAKRLNDNLRYRGFTSVLVGDNLYQYQAMVDYPSKVQVRVVR